MTTWATPSILTADRHHEAVSHLKRYFEVTLYSGSYFERLGGGGDRREVANVVTTDDIVSLSMLSVPVNGTAARQLLGGDTAAHISRLLGEISNELSLAEEQGRKALAVDGPVAALWKVVREIDTFGPVRTSKLLARKRPHLIPIYDDVLREQFGAQSSSDQWFAWIDLFADVELVKRLEVLRADSKIGRDISLLRILDVVVWMEGKKSRKDEVVASPEVEV